MFNHMQRKKEMLKKYPHISNLFVKDISGGFKSIAAAVVQTAVCTVFSTASWLTYSAVAYTIGATTAQYLFLSNHELSHGMYSESPRKNKLLSILINGPIVVPYAISFREYHLAHHSFLGVPGKDMDLPSEFEKKIVSNSRIRKAIWLTFQIVAYAIRPVLIKSQKITFYHIINLLFQIIYISTIVFFFGWAPVRMMILCVILSGGVHPTAGHFLSEHFTNSSDQETFSYYGPLNMVTLNVGYHCEHHDFQQIPGKYLPLLKNIASEYYEDLEKHHSWTKMLKDFVFDDDISLESRIIKKDKNSMEKVTTYKKNQYGTQKNRDS